MTDLILHIDAEGTPATLGKLTDALADDLAAAEVGPVGAAAAGSVPAFGELVVAASTADDVAAVHRVLVGFLGRSTARSVTVAVNGGTVTVTVATAEETAEALLAAAAG